MTKSGERANQLASDHNVLHAKNMFPGHAACLAEDPLLQVMSAIIRGFRKPVLQTHHSLLWSCLIPLHANSAMVDDLNTVLSLYHPPLMRCMSSCSQCADLSHLTVDPTFDLHKF